MDNAGFLSFATFAWITSMMWAAFRRRLDWNGLRLSPFDESDVNTTRSDFILVILTAFYAHLPYNGCWRGKSTRGWF